MNFVIFIIVFILGTPSLAEGEEKIQLQKKMDIVQNWTSPSPSKSVEEFSDPVRYFGKKLYVRRETNETIDSAEEECGEYPKTISNKTRIGFVWDESFCLEGNFQFQPEGGVSYGIQAVIRF